MVKKSIVFKKQNIILCQVGSPKTTQIKDVRSYLREFLSNERIIDIYRPLWFIILNFFILPFRPKQSAKAYKRIEFCHRFPLVEITNRFAEQLENVLNAKHLQDHLANFDISKNHSKDVKCHDLDLRYTVQASYLLSDPRLTDIIKDNPDSLVIPMFPQFSHTTTSCCTDDIEKVFPEKELPPLINSFHKMKGFIDLSVQRIEDHISKYPVDHLVISFHGVPQRYITQKNDPYLFHCCETFVLLRDLLNFPQHKIHMSFQSRLGSELWLTPYTDEFVLNLIQKEKTNGHTPSVGVYCPSFVADCLETTDEIGTELLHEVEEVGGELVFIPCLNNDRIWIDAFADMVMTFCNENFNKNSERYLEHFYSPTPSKVREIMPKLNEESTPMSQKTKKTIKIIFFTLFLDLVGFSIIFPMFPAVAKYYLEVDPDNYFLKMIFGSISAFSSIGGGDSTMSNMSGIVLFGGALGALYSLLQFFAAPLWGGLSDKFGRRPILLISVFGLFLSYVLWIFSGSFTLLILARFIGGIMGGNISVATAVITDITDKSNRSKGMAFIGIAFACGFIFGPALGGVLTLINPLSLWPGLASIGINPFSMAALLAAILSFVNLVILYFSFKETKKSNQDEGIVRTANIFSLFKPLPIKEVNRTNYVYFLFISAFSGMEFTLTFLAVERLHNNSMDNSYMFIFIGLVLVLVQGGFVRRKAHQIGEKKVALLGLVLLIPGLIFIGLAQSYFILYVGLFFLATGSAMAIPTLTSLVSFFTPQQLQGQSLGIFRSLGALGRVIGPIVASIIYWKLGGAYPYLLGAIFLLIPIIILKNIQNKA